MLSQSTIKNQIASHRSILTDKYHITSLFLFGSYARNEAHENSDIDLLVDFSETPDLLSFIETEEYLNSLFGKVVDLVPKRKLREELKQEVLQEAVRL